jgi:hypothetical protein
MSDLRFGSDKEMLAATRHAVIRLMPFDLQRILNTGHYDADYKRDTGWCYDIAARVIAYALEHAPEDATGVPCPLCQDTTTEFYSGRRGFTDEGLRRHLTGHGSNARCDVFEIAQARMFNHWKEEYGWKPW